MKTSVVIPSYNSRQHIRLCLGALMKQSVAPDEIIVVDSSNDETPDIIRKEFPTVALHRLEKQTMPGRARNIGMDLASGDIIIFTDSDAVADLDWVENHVLLHKTMPNVILFGGSILNNNPEYLFSRLAYVSEFTGYSKKDPAEYRTVVPSVNMSAKRIPLADSGVRMPEAALPGGEDVYFCNALVKLGQKVRFDPAPTIRHINRTTWTSFIGHMRSSGYAGGVVAARHAVTYQILSRIGPLALLAAPVRLLLVWKRLLQTDRKAFVESLLTSPVLLTGFLVHMWNYYKGADDASPNHRNRLHTALVIALVSALSLCMGLSTSLTMTSDPSCYLNYAKQLSSGKIFFESLPAQIVYEHGGKFSESVFQGYIFANKDRLLYPYVSIGFPALLALWIKLFGLVSAILFNVWLMPVFLILYCLFWSNIMPPDDILNKKWLGLLSIAIIFCHFRDSLASWTMPYRELPSVACALFALILASVSFSTKTRNILRASLVGALIGIATTIRETSVFMVAPAVLIMAINAAKQRVPWRNLLLHCALIAAVTGTGLGIGYSPQLAINKIQRGSFVGEQFEKATANMKISDKPELKTNSGGGLSLFTLQKNLPKRLNMIRNAAGYLLVFVLAGLLLSLNGKYIVTAVASILPASIYILLYSAFDQIPGADRYEMMIYLFLVPLSAFGLIRSIELGGRLLRWKLDPRLTSLALGVLIVFLCGYQARAMIRCISPEAIRISDLQYFQNEMSSRMDNQSIVLCELPARDYIQYLTRAHTASLYNILEHSITIRHLIQYSADHDIKLFLFNAFNQDCNSTPYAINEIEGMLASEGRLERVYTVPYGNSRLTSILGPDNPNLIRILPLTNTMTKIRLKRDYEGPCRLEADIGVLEGNEEPEITLAGQKVKGIFVGHRRFIGDTPIVLDGSNVELQIHTQQPHSENIRIALLPPAGSLFSKLGVDASDFPFLGRGWFTSKDPSANRICRRLPQLSDLTPRQCAPVIQDRATIYMGIYPLDPLAQTNVNISWSTDKTNWHETIRCHNADDFMIGFVIRNCSARENIYLKNSSSVMIYPYILAFGREYEHLDILPTAPENEKGAIWNVLTIDDDKKNNVSAKTFAVVCPEWTTNPLTGNSVLPANDNIHYSVDPESRIVLSGNSSQTFMLLYPVPFESGKPLTPPLDDLTMEPIYQSGFYGAEPEGRWTKPEAQLLLPPQLSKHGGDITIYYHDHRPPNAPSTEVAVFHNGAQLVQATTLNCPATHILKCRIQPAPPTIHNNNRFLIIKSNAWRPFDLIPGSGDKRLLGIFIKKIETEMRK